MIRSAVIVTGLFFSVSILSADEVTFWNNVLLDSIRASSTPPPRASRAMAMVHTAIYDAVNSVDRTHRPYAQYVMASNSTSREAAAAQAARDVLVSLYPARAPLFDLALADRLALIANGSAKSEGLSVGASSAAQILALRANDNSDMVVPYTPGTNPGDWQPTPPANAPALLPNWPLVTPWAMSSASQFSGFGAPPAMGSPEYQAALAEVRDIGRIDSATRTADQTDIARYWADGAGTATPPGHWNRIAQGIAQSEGLGLSDTARLFAQLNIAMADAAIVAWDYKYDFNYWRPITAIRSTDPNNVDWTPLLVTPPFPSFTSGHSTFSGAASALLAEWFGDATLFTSSSEGFVTPDRSFTSFSQAADEAGMSRIYGGIHFNFDNTIGLASGRSLGQFVYGNQLQAIPEVGNAWLIGGVVLLSQMVWRWKKVRKVSCDGSCA